MESTEKGITEIKKAPEIVAPAGNMDAFFAALSSGADAIYLGVKNFNARRRAENFEISEIPEIIKEAHLRDKKVYITLNILLKNSELAEAFRVAEKVIEAGADAIVVQDLGFASLLLRCFEGLRIHASTQINAHNIPTVNLLKDMGFKRVVLSRELSVPEIERIVDETGVEVEVFIHGALCYSYSGQCLFSSLVGRRSGNRGLCAQPCRLPYDLVAVKDRRKLEMDLPFSYLISTKDLLGIHRLYDLVKAGVAAFKIEGRLKSPEYVSLVTEVYSKELQRAIELRDRFVPLKESIEILEEAFSRGFSPAYLAGERGNAMMSYTRPNNRGVFVGRVVYVDAITGKVGINLRKNVYKGDVLEFWTSRKGKVTQKVNRLFTDSGEADVLQAGERAHVIVEKDRHLIKAGDRVYRVLNARLLGEIRSQIKSVKKGDYPLKVELEILEEGTAKIVAECNDKKVELKSRVSLEPALKAETTEEIIFNQLSRLGGTPYVLATATIKVPRGVHIRLKEINRLRREMVEALNRERLKDYEQRASKKCGFEHLLKIIERKQKRFKLTPALAVKVADVETFQRVLAYRPDVVFFRYPFFRNSGIERFDQLANLAWQAKRKGVDFGIALPQVFKDEEIERLVLALEEARSVIHYVLADNIGLARLLVDKGFQVISDYHLNVFNTFTAELYANLGFRYVTLSAELNLDEISGILNSSPGNYQALVAGDIELMVAEHCPLTVLYQAKNLHDIESKEVKPCVILAREKAIYPRFCELASFNLRDGEGYDFPVRCDRSCRGYVYNSRILCAYEFVERLYSRGVNFFRIDLLAQRDVPPEKIDSLLLAFRQAVDLLKKGKQVQATSDVCPQPFTKGHFERGVV